MPGFQVETVKSGNSTLCEWMGHPEILIDRFCGTGSVVTASRVEIMADFGNVKSACIV